MNVDASDSNDPDVKHISAAEYRAMTVNLSRMLPFCASDVALTTLNRKIENYRPRLAGTVAPSAGVARYAPENITPIFRSQEVEFT